MKKVLVSFVCILFSVVVSAAQIDWHTGDISLGFSDGTAYLIQKTTGDTTISEIYNVLTSTGINTGYDKTQYVLLSNPTLESDGSVAYIDRDTVGVSKGIYENLFVVVVSKDGTKFSIYNVFETADASVSDTAIADVTFGTVGSTDGWTEGTLGHDTPSVPEPTVLALLALGVAGLALKRRV